jgi:hypothetical protein
MRKLVIALATSAGMGLLATSGAMAAPFGGVALDNAATSTSTVTDVRYGCCRPKPKVKWICPRCYRWVCHKVYKRR